LSLESYYMDSQQLLSSNHTKILVDGVDITTQIRSFNVSFASSSFINIDMIITQPIQGNLIDIENTDEFFHKSAQEAIKEINGKELLFYASPFLGKPYSEQTSNMLLRGIIWAYPKVEPKIHTSNVHPKRTFSYFVSNYFDIEMKFYLSSHFQRKEYERSYES